MTDSIAERLQNALTDRYRLLNELGRGGMAIVFLAEDLRHGRRVAVKVLLPEIGETVGARRFAREIQVAATLHHPHILGLHDSGTAGELLYYVMPFVEGESLRARLARDRQLPVDEALRIAAEVCDALDYAHKRGVVHRDIKPENILLSGGHALVADFGIALAIAEEDGNKLTQTGITIGTPVYMSPEQGVGDAVGPSSDLYSLGCVVFEMLVGEPPFSGPSQRAILARHAMEQVPSLRVVRDTIPPHVEAAVRRCLSKLPADRPASASAFAAELARAVPTSSPAPSATVAEAQAAPVASRATAPVTRMRAITVGTVIAVLALAALGGRWVTSRGAAGSTAASAPLLLAVLHFDDASTDRSLDFVAAGITNGVIATLSRVNGLSVVSSAGVAPYRGSRIPRDSIARALKATNLVVGSVEPEGDSIRTTVRLLDDMAVELGIASFKWPASSMSSSLADHATDSVARLIRHALGRSMELVRTRSRTENAQAWALYQRAFLLRARADSLFRADDSTWKLRYRQADSVARLSEERDRAWTEPSVLRGSLAYQRSRRAFVSRDADPIALVDTGTTHVERALANDARDADALEVRGTLRYWRWLIGANPDSALLRAARADLEQATRSNPTQAGAWATLSHLYNNVAGATSTDVEFAARKALESDMFLDNANVITRRLFLAAYDDNRMADAEKWCLQGAERFRHDADFVSCQLYLLSSGVGRLDAARAWQLAGEMVERTPAQAERAFNRAQSRVLVGLVLARLGLSDSARALLSEPVLPEVDPTLDINFFVERGWLLLGDTAKALQALDAFRKANPRLGDLCTNEPTHYSCAFRK